MSQHQITVERPWKGIPTKQLVNIETGQTEVFVKDIFGDVKIAEAGADNKWKITDENELLKRYNNKNPKDLTGKELQKEFNNSGVKQFNSDRADVINKNSPENTKTFLATKQNPVPGTIDPKTGIEAEKTSPPPAADTGGDPNNATQTQFQTIAETAAKSYKGRRKYPEDLRYPENMNKNQDCIQFKIIEYIPSKLGLTGSEDIKLRTTFGTRSPLSTITLPMPSGGISDRNSVNWQGSGLDVAQDALATVAMNAILGGVGAGADAAKKELTKATAGNKDLLAAIIAAKASERAVGANGLLSRAFGVELNPNLELLFNSPELREFSFSFKMTPRSKSEAQIVRSIIRTFKQAMSVKRSESVLLLKAPHTFRISYLTSTKDHPYLNRFKECALTNCSVNYTPDNSYMSYDDSDPDGRSMTAYELSLNFSELEPIFDDDYTRLPGGDEEDSKDYSIGY
jgi:hypothetical protein